ncbi:MAG: glycoside hydrolase family 95 protein [Marinilabiliaceae bacterium]|jgi:alpha-L-fucosidase 2|nr:glycoside hydrolase family 95 protein [Marinilabiliaceae bacterium]
MNNKPGYLFSLFLFTGLYLNISAQDIDFNPSLQMWYKQAAGAWEEALPVGNGRLGAMVFGKFNEERIQVNEDTYWSGGPYSTVVKGGHSYLPEIQRLIFEGKPLDAHKLFGRYLMGYPVEQQKYQSLANIHLFLGEDTAVNNYSRYLDLATGITGVKYTLGDVNYTREVFASAPHNVIVIRLSSDRPGGISLRAQLRGCRNMAHSNYGTDYFRMDPLDSRSLMLYGKSADYLGIEGKLRYKAVLRAESEGGNVRTNGIDLLVENASALTLYLVAATNFINYNDVSADVDERIENYLEGIKGLSYNDIKSEAIKDYQELFNRVSLELPESSGSYLPTDKRMKLLAEQPDPSLAALAYNFGRYVLISSSRPGTQPANLQGIWNKDQNPSWDSKYTTNINTEMNYWPVESANLSECAEPLIKMVEELSDQGAEVAKEHYGCRGWVFHQNTDLWRVAAPMDGPTWGTFTTGGAWLCTHLWEHYLYNPDRDYLERIYPLLKGSVDFFMDFLIEHPNGKWLVTNPSNSPENPPEGEGYRYFYDEVTGMYYFTTICYGSSIDMQIINDLFKYYSQAASITGRDEEYAVEVDRARKKLVPPAIGKDGSLQEWTEDYGQLEEKHRHFSHMYGLYPGTVISARRTPELIDACKAVLEQRGDGGTGFSRGWKMALWSRLYDGERANKIFKGYINEQAYPQLFAKCYTPLQVDGTLGVTAGITEMLLHSHEAYIELLPALPGEWNKGEFRGVRARGGFELSFSWEKAKVKSLEVLSLKGEECRIKNTDIIKISCEGRRTRFTADAKGIVSFSTSAGKNYKIEFKDNK